MIVDKFKIQSIAFESGFHLVGFCSAQIPEQDKQNIIKFVQKKYHGDMEWFSRNLDIKLNLINLGLNPKSVIVLGIRYRDPSYEEILAQKKYKLSRYAVGQDYHTTIKNLAKPLLQYLKVNFPQNRFRMGVDSLPVLEKVYARESGIGWQGKNTLIIHPQMGSFFFLAVILTDLELTADSPISNRCGTCTKCIDACPTQAILSNRQIEANRCISYYTIECKKVEIPESTSDWIFGCDICQEVCPWNKIKPNRKQFLDKDEFKIRKTLLETDESSYTNLTEIKFYELIKNSSMNRISFEQFQRNIQHCNSKTH